MCATRRWIRPSAGPPNLLIPRLSTEEGKLNRVPLQCTIGAALSFPPGETLASVQAEIVHAIDRACAADPFLSHHRPDIAWDSGVTGAEVPPGHALFQTAAGVIADVTGERAEANVLHTSSDIRNPINQAGIPTIGLGPLGGDLSQNGGHDEWVDVEDYLRSVQVAAGIAIAWCGHSRPAHAAIRLKTER